MISNCRWDHAKSERCDLLSEDLLSKIRLKHVGALDGYEVYIVRGEYVRDYADVDFTEGGNPARYGYIPMTDIWVESTDHPRDKAATILHEVVEAMLMIEKGWSYDKAHEFAAQYEDKFRQGTKGQEEEDLLHQVMPWYEAFERKLHGHSKQARTFNINEGDPVLFGKARAQQQHVPPQVSPVLPPQEAPVMQVTARYLRRKQAVNPALHAEYHHKLEAFKADQEYVREMSYLEGTAERWLAWFAFYQVGRKWADHVIDHLAIPPKAAKSVEMAVRLFSKAYGRGKAPPSISKWYTDNAARFELLDEAGKWPDRSAESDVFKLGPFTVHNTVHAPAKDLASTKAIVEKALKALPNTGITDFPSMAYGALYLVGQLGRKNWAAWYMPSKDFVYLRPSIRGIPPEDAAKHLIHELGHRYWAKKLEMFTKSAWEHHHLRMTYTPPKASLPAVGDILPMVVNGKKVRLDSWDPKQELAVLVDVKTEQPIGQVLRQKLMEWMLNAAQKLSFPSLYASTDAQEHFCESLALRALGKLDGKNLEAFDKIILKGEAMGATQRIARAYLRQQVHKRLAALRALA